MFQSKQLRRSKIFSWIGLLLVACLVVIACSEAPEASNPSTESASSTSEIPAEIVVASEDDFPPFDFLDNGQHVGYNQDLLNFVIQEKSLKVKQEVLPFQGILAGIASEKYTTSNAAIGISAQRAETVDFTMPVTELTHFFLTRKADTRIKSLDDFSGKVIAIQQGGISAAVFENSVKPELAKKGLTVGTVKQYGAFTEAYQDLLNQRVDVVINNIVALKRLVSEKPDLYQLGSQVGPKVYAAWAVKKGNKAMLELMNDGLAKAKSSGEMKRLQEKWLKVSFNLPDKPEIPPV